MIQRVTTQVDYLLREAFTGLRRNLWMIWSAVSTLAVLLFLLGLGLRASWQLQDAVSDLGSRLEISIYLDPGVRAAAVEPDLRTLVGVDEIKSVSKEQAWAALKKDLGVRSDPGESLGGNPLVDSLRVRIAQPEAVAPLAAQIQQIEGVEEVSYGSEAAQRLDQIQQAMRWVGLALTAVLGVATVAVITSTIRLIVQSRRKEIEVMQLVGATPLRISMPFILEGLAFGIAGALIAWGLIEATSRVVAQKQLELLPFLQWQPSEPAAFTLPLILLGVGVALGMLGSLIAVRRAIR
ncbi:cell division protein FtsX [Gloeobacter violaceus]|uniref:Cell division protein FtsX n=1 Tax=Gloeobacter violaceus (strain ATCC 29082 / PCC 7421) TaxID=251221 RepID=Q7NMW7_GLOVI|nr:permease-like cell division protein FtsX [Gloeobacter violaceus]BAC88589.1 gll0648 [Gloeobacter violaceus PCC 7421]